MGSAKAPASSSKQAAAAARADGAASRARAAEASLGAAAASVAPLCASARLGVRVECLPAPLSPDQLAWVMALLRRRAVRGRGGAPAAAAACGRFGGSAQPLPRSSAPPSPSPYPPPPRSNMSPVYGPEAWPAQERARLRAARAPGSRFLFAHPLPPATAGDAAAAADDQPPPPAAPLGFAQYECTVEEGLPVLYLLELQVAGARTRRAAHHVAH